MLQTNYNNHPYFTLRIAIDYNGGAMRPLYNLWNNVFAKWTLIYNTQYKRLLKANG